MIINGFLHECSLKLYKTGLPNKKSQSRGTSGKCVRSNTSYDMPSAGTMLLADHNDMLVTTFEDDTAVLARHYCVFTATVSLQLYLNNLRTGSFAGTSQSIRKSVFS